eukprot:scaffold11853_cov163-Skeletonema_menzelii.AAC.1
MSKASSRKWLETAKLPSMIERMAARAPYDADEKRKLHHLTEAAIGGHPKARHNFACFEGQRGMVDRAAKHFIIAAKLGFDWSLESVKELYNAAALRGHQAAIDATKSPQREEAAETAILACNDKSFQLRR